MAVTKVADILNGREVVTLGPDASVAEACALLDRHNIGALGVVAEGALLGILSERDVIRRCIAPGRLPAETLVRSVMTADPATIAPADPVLEALDVMYGFGFRHLPVVDEAGRLAAMLSMRDIPKEYRLAAERSVPDAAEIRPC